MDKESERVKGREGYEGVNVLIPRGRTVLAGTI